MHTWQHIIQDVKGDPITVDRYYIYRDTTPCLDAGATEYVVINGPFLRSSLTLYDPDVIGDPAQNDYYYVQAAVSDKYGNDVCSDLSNHVGEFDFDLVPGMPQVSEKAVFRRMAK